MSGIPIEDACTRASGNVGELRNLWIEILGVSELQEGDNFFGLGGDSLKATLLVCAINDKFGLLIDEIEVFENPVFLNFSELLSFYLSQSESQPAKLDASDNA
jgi:acyl carrier protein